MARRLAPIAHPAVLELDGHRLEAELGEPIAFALIADDKVALSRGPKLHRPRGPSCLRGGCDGCALRVNGEPNVLTCLVPVRGGEIITTQNVLGSRKLDLLQVSDWFFPHGIDHHHLLAGVPAASPIVQRLARHVAGLGRVPDAPPRQGTARREQPDVLVVGGGPAGLHVAQILAESSSTRVVLVDDAVTLGGSLRARGKKVPLHEFTSQLTVHLETTAVGLYDREVLLVRGLQATLVRPRAVVLATGTHDGAVAFANNDLPGIFSARAGALLAMHGIAVGERVGLLGRGPYVDAFVGAMGSEVRTVAWPGGEVSARGRSRLRAVETSSGARHEVDALLVEAPGAPCFELAQQAGVSVTWSGERAGYAPALDSSGRALPWLWCAGELAGTGPHLADIERQAATVAEGMREALAGLSLR